MRPSNRTSLAAPLVVGLLAIVAAALASPVAAAGHAVAIRDASFGPKTITIRAGDRVTWTNTGSNNHNVTFDTFASNEQMDPGSKYSHTFRSAGTFSYTCTLHGFNGTVIVKAAVTPKPKPTVKPTPKPTPKPTAKPQATATSAPAIASPPPTPASSLAIAGSPGATSSSAEPAAPSSAAGPSASPGGDASGDASQTGASAVPLALLVALVAVGVVAVGAVVVRRR